MRLYKESYKNLSLSEDVAELQKQVMELQEALCYYAEREHVQIAGEWLQSLFGNRFKSVGFDFPSKKSTIRIESGLKARQALNAGKSRVFIQRNNAAFLEQTQKLHQEILEEKEQSKCKTK